VRQMQDQLFDRQLGMLFVSDAVRAIPEGTSVLSQINRRLASPRTARRHSLVIGATATAIVLGLILAVTPARASFGDLLRFTFVQRFGTVLVTPASTPARSAAAAGGQSSIIGHSEAMPRLTLAEAQQLAGFHIPQPSFLPAGVVFRFAFASTDHTTAVLSYGRAGTESSGMFIQIEDGAAGGGYAIPAAAAQTVKVNGHDAVYARGSSDQSGTWNGKADSALLSWQGGAFTYVMSYSGLGLSQTDMILIAESLK
jgi:hypothetical protein